MEETEFNEKNIQKILDKYGLKYEENENIFLDLIVSIKKLNQ